MIWIDFTLLWYAAFCLCSILGEQVFQWERLALAFILSLAIKSLILFFLIRFGIQPVAIIQLGASSIVLAVTLIFSVKPDWKGTEIRFDSEWVVPQLKQYPPFIPLLFTYFISFDFGFLKICFPSLFLCLNIIFYSRVLSLTKNIKMACMFTMVLGTTPYFWWHGMLPFLDLTTAVFYSTGTLYWYFWIENKVEGSTEKSEENSYAAISGVLLGLAAWTRIEFLLYNLVPVFLTLYVFSKYPEKNENLKPLKLFFLCLLFFPSIWFLNLLTFDMALWSQMKMVGGVCVILWGLALVLTLGRWRLSVSSVQLAFVLSVAGYILLLFLFAGDTVSVWEKLTISFYRTSTVHIFYLFTVSLLVFIFFEKLNALSDQKKILGFFLILFLSTHWAIFSYSTPKWPTLGAFVYATFIQPGNSVNLSDTRGMMSFYPIFMFFISSLPFVRRGIINE
jgi:hypothetical protein